MEVNKMKKENIEIIISALKCQISDFQHCADVRYSEGDYESQIFFIEQANEVKKALAEFIDMNPA